MTVFFTNRQYSNDYKLDTYLKIARLYLEDEDSVQAEAYINRASILQADSQNKELQIYYKVNNGLPNICSVVIVSRRSEDLLNSGENVGHVFLSS